VTCAVEPVAAPDDTPLRAMIRQDEVALQVLSRDRAVGFYADIDTFGGHTPPDYVVRCWHSRRLIG
jgi:hypothetical protein